MEVNISFEEDVMIVKRGDSELRIALSETSQRLLNATEAERWNFKISPSGYGVHWPMLDEDISIVELNNIVPEQ